MTLAQKALDVAISQLGVQEHPKGSNRGLQVDEYIRSVGLDPTKGSYAWCMAFQYWCHVQAANAMGRNPLMSKTGGVLDQWNKRKAAYRVITPQPGDIFVMDYGKGQGHTGIVEKVNEDGTIDTIEGNTDSQGGREGYEVCRRVRQRSKILGYLRFD